MIHFQSIFLVSKNGESFLSTSEPAQLAANTVLDQVIHTCLDSVLLAKYTKFEVGRYKNVTVYFDSPKGGIYFPLSVLRSPKKFEEFFFQLVSRSVLGRKFPISSISNVVAIEGITLYEFTFKDLSSHNLSIYLNKKRREMLGEVPKESVSNSVEDLVQRRLRRNARELLEEYDRVYMTGNPSQNAESLYFLLQEFAVEKTLKQ